MKTPIVLLVDDEIESIQSVIACFERYPLKLEFMMANSGYIALSVLEKHTPNLIVLDWDMPGMSGIELMQKIKGQERLVHIPIVMLTGVMTEMKYLHQALEAGAIDFVRKPFDELELYSRVHAALQFSETLQEKFKSEEAARQAKQRLVEMEKEQLEADIAQQKSELLNNALQLRQAAELQEANLVLLKELRTSLKSEGKPILDQIIANYRMSQKQSQWENMKAKFDKAFSDYDKKLSDRFPSLSPNERRLCTFLHLNMSSKDIAIITFQKESSINQARYRLRKKLGISSDENLVDFLTKL